MSADADTSGAYRRHECPRCASHVEQLGAVREENSRVIRERDEAHKTLRRYEDEAANERGADGFVAALALVGGGTIVLALVCLVVLALRLAGGAS